MRDLKVAVTNHDSLFMVEAKAKEGYFAFFLKAEIIESELYLVT